MLKVRRENLSSPPSWCPGCPLAGESCLDVGQTSF